jgi:hypothetical protein
MHCRRVPIVPRVSDPQEPGNRILLIDISAKPATNYRAEITLPAIAMSKNYVGQWLDRDDYSSI